MRLLHLLPLLCFLALAMWLGHGLLTHQAEPPSSRQGGMLPAIELPNLEADKPALKSADWQGKMAVLNIFASWCISCTVEQPALLELAKQGVPLYGMAWKDAPENTRAWLQQWGNPYTKIGTDLTGQTAIRLGITGAPETFVIGTRGEVLLHVAGPLDEDSVAEIRRLTYD